MNGKLGNESLGEFKLGDAELEAIISPVFPGMGGQELRGYRLPRWEELHPDEDAAIAFVLTRV